MALDAGPDLVLMNGEFTTLDRQNPNATGGRDHAGRFAAVGAIADIMPTASARTRVIDLKGRRVVPGLSTATRTSSAAA